MDLDHRRRPFPHRAVGQSVRHPSPTGEAAPITFSCHLLCDILHHKQKHMQSMMPVIAWQLQDIVCNEKERMKVGV